MSDLATATPWIIAGALFLTFLLALFRYRFYLTRKFRGRVRSDRGDRGDP